MRKLVQPCLTFRYAHHLLLWGMTLAAVMWVTPAAAQMPCASTESITASIASGKTRLAAEAIDYAGRLVRIIVLPDGGWMAWGTAPGADISCMGAGGSDWHDVPVAEVPDGPDL